MMRLALTISALALAVCSMAQTPGQIFRTAVNDSLLDPNGDGYISQTTSGFSDTPTIIDESEEFETAWNVLWHFEAEPSSDLQTGSTCGPTEIVDNPNTNEHAAYWKIHDPDGVAGNDDELLMFRMRINQDPNNAAYGYSFLIDSDQQFGITGSNVDPNAMAGNPGFEYEILFASGNSGGVYVNDVDGVAQHNQITNLKTYNDGVNDQRAYARFSNCTGTTDPIFIDFFIAFADLGSAVTSNSTLRMVFASASSANSALNGSASDVGGIADGDYPDDDSMFETYVAAVPTIQFSTGYSIVDVDNDGVDDATDNCVDLAACNYDGSVNNVACQFNDACGVCGGSGVDVDADGVCDDVDNCTNTSACNYDGSTSNVACQFNDACGVCGGSGVDVDADGVCDDVDLCTDNTACNYQANPTAACATVDACGVCGGSGVDVDADGVCDDVDLCTDNTACNYQANPTAACATVDACGVCGGSGVDVDADGVCDDVDLCTDNTACNYQANPTAACATVDACGVCGGSGVDVDADGVCDDVDNCTNTSACNYDGSTSNVACQFNDACGVCGGSGVDVDADGVCDDVDLCTDNTACNYQANPTAACATVDACGVCGGSGVDVDADGVCDDVDLCTDNTACNYQANPTAACATVDACGVCGGSGVDVDADGVCDDVDLCTDNTACNYQANPTAACATVDACGVCGGSGVDVDADGVCDDVDNCTNTSACNYDGSTSNVACQFNDACGVCGGSGVDVDADGVCDDVDLCTDNTACNYQANPTAACATVDACGVCGGSGVDVDADGVCDDVDLCTDNTACNYQANPTAACATVDACGVCGGSGVDVDADGVCDDVDLCTDNTACNYQANPTAGCATVDACGVCGGDNSTCLDCAGVPNGSATVDAIGVCGGTCTTDSDSDGVCDDGGADLCMDNTASNYTANPTEACNFPAPATAVSDTIMGCVDQTDAVALDLDTLHTGTGSWNYTISQDVTGTYAAATLTGSVLSVDFSAAGQDSSTVELTGTNGTDNIAFNILVVEGTYPFVTSSAPDGGNQPTSPTGGVGMTFDGGYGVPLMVHYFEDAVYALAPDGSSSWHAHGEELTAMTDSSGSLITLPAGDYFITGYTNHWGCYNPEPATSGTPTANPSYRLITVSHLLPD